MSLRKSSIEVQTSGTVLNPLDLAHYNMRATEAAKRAPKREPTPSGVISEKEQKEILSIGAQLADLYIADRIMQSPEADDTLHRIVDQTIEDYFRNNTHPEMDIVLEPRFRERLANYARVNADKLVGTVDAPLDPKLAYLRFQKLLDEVIRRDLAKKEAN